MANALFNERTDKLRHRILSPLTFRLFMWKQLPLAGFAGLHLRSLDEGGCTVILPGGWRTQNPFQSTYFAAQAMAAEMSTGAPALILVQGNDAKISLLVTDVRARYTKKVAGESQFTFREVGEMAETIERAGKTGEPATYLAKSVGRNAAGDIASEFEILWSFKRRD
ncbi:MAG: thioesterase [Vicinamibacteria bacterium]